MAGIFINFWNAPLVNSPLVLNGPDQTAFWVIVDFLENMISGDPDLRNDNGCAALISGAKNVTTLDFSCLSDSATRQIRVELEALRDREHFYWSTPISWNKFGGWGVSIHEPSSQDECNVIMERSRELAEIIFLNLVCAESDAREQNAAEQPATAPQSKSK